MTTFPLTLGIPPKTVTFANAEELIAAAEALVRPGRTYGPRDVQIILRAADLPGANGLLTAAARPFRTYGPTKPDPVATPYDERLEDVEAKIRAAELEFNAAVGRRAQAEADVEAMRRRLRIQHRDDAVARADAIAEAEEEATPRWKEALLDQEEADRHLVRLRARRSALGEVRRRWLVEHTGQFYDRYNPDEPLSLAEMRARRDAEGENG